MVQHGPLRIRHRHEAVVAPRRKDTHGDLHDLIHYPTPHSSSAVHSDLEMRVLELERKLKKMGKRVG